MKRLFYLIILGGAILTIQSCGVSQAGGSITSCSCAPRIGHEARNLNLTFQESDITEILKIRGFYGTEGEDGSCCGPYSEDELTGQSNHLDLERVDANRLASYSRQTYIAFSGVFLANQWTLQLWLNPLGNTSSGIIMEENIDSKKALFLSLADDKKLLFNLPPSDHSPRKTHLNIESSSTLTVNTWQHIAVAVSGNDVAFYINGVLDKQQNFDSGVYNHLQARSSFSLGQKSLCFGSCHLNTSDTSFQGKLDDIEFINRVLDAGEILNNYQASQNSFP